ncbi:MAG TPA: hypothetical protein VFY40_16445 [Blastocatellia bacterium]|nr:hypothetical protein [Blastocatellia bacterium]
MICLGSSQGSPDSNESLAAQLKIVDLFRADFTRRYPGGIVLSELDYMGRTTSAPNYPGPVQIPGNARLTAVLAALTSDFRNWVKSRDYRKCDALGISADGVSAELLEVTTINRVAGAVAQLNVKLDILKRTVNRIHTLSTDWRISPWRPGPGQWFYPLPSSIPTKLRYICYQMMGRPPAPEGVILYEIHEVARPVVPVPLKIPDDAADRIRRAARSNPPTVNGAEAWARRFLDENPNVAQALAVLGVAAAIIMLLGALILIFDPAPGDELAVFYAAMWLLRLSLRLAPRAAPLM